MTRRRPLAGLVLALTVLLAQGVFGGMIGVGAAEGLLIRIGGNAGGCPTDKEVTDDLLQHQTDPQNRFKPLAISGGVFTRDRGIQAITSNPLVGGPGGVFLLSQEQILGATSIIAESLTVGDDALSAKTFQTRGLAAYGNSIWVVQSRQSTAKDPDAVLLPGRIRRVDLATHEVTTVAPTKGPNPKAIAADGAGNLYVADANSDVYMIGRGGGNITLPSVDNPTGIAVDVLGTEVYVTGSGGLYRLSGSSKQLIAGPAIPHSDGTPPVRAPNAVAVGHEIIEGQAPRARYVYIADGPRVVRVDLKGPSPTISTVAGGGSSFVSSSTADARTAKLSTGVLSLAADIAAHVYIADPDQCAVYQLETPAPFALNTAVTNPPAVTNTTLPNGGSRTGDADKPAPDSAGAGNSSPQADPGSAQTAGQGNQTQIVPGSQTQVQAPQTELRIIDQSNVVAPDQGTQTIVNPVPSPTPSPAPISTPASAPAPTPTPDAGTVTLVDPGTSSAGVVPDAAPVVPTAPAVAPVPPAPASAPPPAAPQPVSNPGLVHGDSAQPVRGATRYAMVRNDDDQSPAGPMAMAGAGGLLAVFICAMFVAPGASSKPKPRPRRAY